MPKFPSLGQPLQIGGIEIKNRIGMAATGTMQADVFGHETEQMFCFYGARAKGGAGLIIVGGAYGSAMFQGCPANLTDEQWEEWKKNYWMGIIHHIWRETDIPGHHELAETIHAFGAKCFLQTLESWGRQACAPDDWIIGPSAIPIDVPTENLVQGSDMALMKHVGVIGRRKPPREVTKIELKRSLEDLVKSCLHIRQAGYDGVELHFAHGYLAASFLSPRANKRTDEYGGSLENRMRHVLDIARAVKEEIKDTMVVGFRMSEDEHMPDGMSHADAIQVAIALEKVGMQFMHLSSGCYEAINYTVPFKDGTMIEPAKDFKKALKIPVLCPSVHDPKLAEDAVKNGKADMITLSRALLADPEWPNKVLQGRDNEVTRCIKCGTCWNYLWRGQPLRCTQNPNLGRERYMPEYWRPPMKASTKLPPGWWESSLGNQ